MEAYIQNDGGNIIPIRARAMQLPSGDAGIRQTIALMQQDANGQEGAQHPGIRAFALQAIANTPDRDDLAQATAIFQAVKKQIKFRGEYEETVQTPWLTLQLRAGDCDDHTTLLVALLKSVGIPARIQTVALHKDQQFEHVFAMAGIRGRTGQIEQWIPLDTTVPFAKPGWQPPYATRRKVWRGRTLGKVNWDELNKFVTNVSGEVRANIATAKGYPDPNAPLPPMPPNTQQQPLPPGSTGVTAAGGFSLTGQQMMFGGIAAAVVLALLIRR